jgi:hypothetical protein
MCSGEEGCAFKGFVRGEAGASYPAHRSPGTSVEYRGSPSAPQALLSGDPCHFIAASCRQLFSGSCDARLQFDALFE